MLNLETLGKFALDQGDWQSARAHFEECLEVAQEVSYRFYLTGVLLQLGYTAIKQGDYAGAYSFLAESLAIRLALGSKPDVGGPLDFLAVLATAQGEYARAVRILGAAEAFREHPRPVLIHEVFRYETLIQSEQDRLLTEARAALGEEAFHVAWTEGQAMTLEQAAGYYLSAECLASLAEPHLA
ncbi:MAG TPA: tetratricopeptide repeat protein [Chthonomonadaceae bacterium]|nr:tetratricopeptide repeat protein [Chthonomonadaceae bacterium]